MSSPSAASESLPSIYDQTKSIMPVYWSYFGLGVFALVANFFVVFVYLSSSTLRTRYALFIGLAVAEGVNGMAFLFTGFERASKILSLQDTYTFPKVSRSDCAAQIGNTFQLIGSQGPALITMALGIERFCAIKFPASYRKFKAKMFHLLLIVTAFCCLLSAMVALYIGLIIEKDIPAFFTCSLSNAFGYGYTTFNYLFTSFGHVAGFTLNFCAFWIIHNFKNGGIINKAFSKEVDQIRLMHFVSMCSLVMVVAPNLFIYAARFNFYIVDNYVLGWLNCAFVFRSGFSLHLLGFRSPKFRQRFYELTGCFITRIKPSQSDEAIKSITIPAGRQYAHHHPPVSESPVTIF